MKQILEFIKQFKSVKKQNELEALDKDHKLDLVCEECGNPSIIINVMGSLFICSDCKEAKERRERLLEAEKEFNN